MPAKQPPPVAPIDEWLDSQTPISTRQLVRLLPVTFRMVQWWDEKGVISPSKENHVRQFTPRQAIAVGVFADLRRRGYTLQQVRWFRPSIIEHLAAHHQLPAYFVIGGRKAAACFEVSEAIDRLSRIRTRQCALVNVRDIASTIWARVALPRSPQK